MILIRNHPRKSLIEYIRLPDNLFIKMWVWAQYKLSRGPWRRPSSDLVAELTNGNEDTLPKWTVHATPPIQLRSSTW